MRGVVAIAGCGLILAACTTSQLGEVTTPLPATSPNTLQLVSTPAGAEAKTTTGQTCTTPCSIVVNVPGEFAVTFSLPGYYPLVATSRLLPPGDSRDPEQQFATERFFPNPLVAELELAPAAPPPVAKKRPPPKRQPVATRRPPPAAPPPPTPAAAPPVEDSAPPVAPPIAQPVSPPPAQPIGPSPGVAYPWPAR